MFRPRLFILLIPSMILFVGCIFTIRKLTQAESIHIQVGNDTRRYLIHIPKTYQSGTKVPLVVVLHGGGGNGRNAEAMSQFSPLADKEGFIVVYPFGWGRLDERLLTWNAGNCCGKALDDKKDDVRFIRELVEKIKQTYSIDSSRVYATGMSNGGMMSHRLACEASDIFSGIGDVSGALNVEPCNPQRSVAVILFHGKADLHVRYDGGAPSKTVDSHPRVDKSVAFAENLWKQKNQCNEGQISKSGKVEHKSYTCNEAGLETYLIDDEGHTWPGGEKGYFGADTPTEEISATEVMWKFWKKHPRR